MVEGFPLWEKKEQWENRKMVMTFDSSYYKFCFLLHWREMSNMAAAAGWGDENTRTAQTDEDGNAAEISTLSKHECCAEGEMSTKRCCVSVPFD